jgi:hypothetical protein
MKSLTEYFPLVWTGFVAYDRVAQTRPTSATGSAVASIVPEALKQPWPGIDMVNPRHGRWRPAGGSTPNRREIEETVNTEKVSATNAENNMGKARRGLALIAGRQYMRGTRVGLLVDLTFLILQQQINQAHGGELPPCLTLGDIDITVRDHRP